MVQRAGFEMSLVLVRMSVRISSGQWLGVLHFFTRALDASEVGAVLEASSGSVSDPAVLLDDKERVPP